MSHRRPRDHGKTLRNSVLSGCSVVATCLAGALGLAASQAPPARASGAALIRHDAFALAYNLDYPQAADALIAGIAAHPDDPSLHRSLAAVTWLMILFSRGAVTVDYFAVGLSARVQIDKPPPELDQRFRAEVERAVTLADAWVHRAPDDPNALYEYGAAIGLRTTYMATVEGGVLAAVRGARSAFNAHEHLLEVDPRRKDAGLIVGSYRYIVSLLSAPLRLMAYIVGFGGGRERGLSMVEEAGAYPSEAQVEALFALLLLYNNEKRYADALRVIDDLQQRFPRNRLLRLEEASMALRAGEAARAVHAASVGLEALRTDPRPRALGEVALWHYKRGAAHLRLGHQEQAAADLRIAEQEAGAPPWIRGRVALELGKVADLAGDQAAARGRYADAARLCEAGHDPTCADEATSLGRTGYKGPR